MHEIKFPLSALKNHGEAGHHVRIRIDDLESIVQIIPVKTAEMLMARYKQPTDLPDYTMYKFTCDAQPDLVGYIWSPHSVTLIEETPCISHPNAEPSPAAALATLA